MEKFFLEQQKFLNERCSSFESDLFLEEKDRIIPWSEVIVSEDKDEFFEEALSIVIEESDSYGPPKRGDLIKFTRYVRNIVNEQVIPLYPGISAIPETSVTSVTKDNLFNDYKGIVIFNGVTLLPLDQTTLNKEYNSIMNVPSIPLQLNVIEEFPLLYWSNILESNYYVRFDLRDFLDSIEANFNVGTEIFGNDFFYSFFDRSNTKNLKELPELLELSKQVISDHFSLMEQYTTTRYYVVGKILRNKSTSLVQTNVSSDVDVNTDEKQNFISPKNRIKYLSVWARIFMENVKTPFGMSLNKIPYYAIDPKNDSGESLIPQEMRKNVLVFPVYVDVDTEEDFM